MSLPFPLAWVSVISVTRMLVPREHSVETHIDLDVDLRHPGEYPVQAYVPRSVGWTARFENFSQLSASPPGP